MRMRFVCGVEYEVNENWMNNELEFEYAFCVLFVGAAAVTVFIVVIIIFLFRIVSFVSLHMVDAVEWWFADEDAHKTRHKYSTHKYIHERVHGDRPSWRWARESNWDCESM